MEPKITIHERFLTFQGEGCQMGRKAYFIRTYGCPLHCDFCDSAGTWHPDFKPKSMERMTAYKLAVAVVESKAPLVVLTGGEPALHDWTSFCNSLYHTVGNRVMVCMETSGAFPIKGGVDWVTVSPKKAKEPCFSAVTSASEFKLIIETPEDIAYWHELLVIRGYTEDKPIWLHPEWSQRENRAVLEAINEAVVNNPWDNDNFRAGYQLHKIYRPDQRDKGCKPDVPLGGGQKREPLPLFPGVDLTTGKFV